MPQIVIVLNCICADQIFDIHRKTILWGKEAVPFSFSFLLQPIIIFACNLCPLSLDPIFLFFLQVSCLTVTILCMLKSSQYVLFYFTTKYFLTHYVTISLHYFLIPSTHITSKEKFLYTHLCCIQLCLFYFLFATATRPYNNSCHCFLFTLICSDSFALHTQPLGPHSVLCVCISNNIL